MAIEDAIVLADELAKTDDVEQSLIAYRERRFEHCRYILEASAICLGQIGLVSLGRKRSRHPRHVRLRGSTDLRSNPMSPTATSQGTEIRNVGYSVADLEAERLFDTDKWCLKEVADRDGMERSIEGVPLFGTIDQPMVKA